MKKGLLSGVMTLAFVGAMAMPAVAQQKSRFEQFQASINKRSSEILQFQRALQDPDMRKQLAALEWMLASNDPALIRIAKEHGLFSTNPVLRSTTLRFILNSGPILRMQCKSVGENSKYVFSLIKYMNGTYMNGSGSFFFKVNQYNSGNSRWSIGSDADASHNFLRLAGTTLSYVISSGNMQDNARATIELGPDGIARGVLLGFRGARLAVAIDFKE